MSQVEILVGSKSDLPYLWGSELLDELDAAEVTWTVSACSAHRNTDELAEYVAATRSDTAVYVCAAGWAAALPGAVKALLLRHSLAPVFGIALPSEDYPDGRDAEISIRRLPPGIEVLFGGVGADGFNAIAEDVIAHAEVCDPANPDPDRLAEVIGKIKPPQFNIPQPEES